MLAMQNDERESSYNDQSHWMPPGSTGKWTLASEKLCTFATSHFDLNFDIKILPDTPRARYCSPRRMQPCFNGSPRLCFNDKDIDGSK